MTIEEVVLYAWVGEDEQGSGELGLKQALCPAGIIPLVSVREEKMRLPFIGLQLQMQATHYGKTIRLCRFTFAGVIEELKP